MELRLSCSSALAWRRCNATRSIGAAFPFGAQVLERRPHARAHTNLAAELKAAGQSDQALTHLKLAASEDPDAQYLLGSALIELGNVHEAVPWLQRFVGSNPTTSYVASARQELADALYREGRLAEAIAQQEIVVSSNPNHANGRLNLAKLLMAANDFNRAAVEYRECLRLEPEIWLPQRGWASHWRRQEAPTRRLKHSARRPGSTPAT